MFAFVAMLCFNACVEDEDPTFVVQEDQIEGPLIVTANSTVTLDKDREGETVFTLVWANASYNVNTPVTYNIEAGLGGTNFEVTLEEPIVAETSDPFYSWTIKEINDLAIALGVPADTEGSIDFRIISTLGTNGGAAITSNSISVTATPYSVLVVEPGIKNLFLVGNGTAANWENNNNNQPVFRDAENTDIFSFTGKFGGSGDLFKFLEQKGAWAPQFGGEAGSLIARPTEDDPDPSPIELPNGTTESYYKIDVNLADLTYTITDFDASSQPTYTTIGIIGDSTNPSDEDNDGTPDGWQTDMDMTQSTYDPHVWYIEDLVLVNGGAKFRAENDWSVNWGGDFFPSTINGSGNDIPITGGTYDVWFNDLTGSFIFLPK
ncbi:hypothetical protein GCM10022258_19120 [Aquimarina gracilis]